MKILKRLGLGLLAIIALLLIVAAFTKKDFHIEWAIVINQPKQTVFSYIRLMKNQNSYSKWAMMDPAARKTYTGTDGMPGFIMAWDGNKDVGKGEQEIKKITGEDRMDTEIRFEKPFKSIAQSYMTAEAASGAQTRVSWAFEGRQAWPTNIIGLFMNMDKMIGDDLQTGLRNLKSNLEKQ